MSNRLPLARQSLCLRLLCEGNSIRSTCRITSTHKDAVSKLILTYGNAALALMDERLRGLNLRHVETDEVWTFVAKKQGHLSMEDRERHDIGDIYLWTCLDADTKLIASHLLGKRSADNARRLMMDLASRIVLPAPGSADDHAYETRRFEPVIQISVDGFAGYPEAIDLAFGPFARAGVLIKDFRNADLPYAPPEMVGSQRRNIRGIDNLFSICTSHVERHNWTIRTFMRRFTRLTCGFSKRLENLEAATHLYLCFYNFVWRSRFPDRSGRAGRLRVPAAMAAGVVDRLWTFDDLFNELLMYA